MSRRRPGYLRLSGFISKPELQKLNRNSIYVFVEWSGSFATG